MKICSSANCCEPKYRQHMERAGSPLLKESPESFVVVVHQIVANQNTHNTRSYTPREEQDNLNN
jgi:hypothetical protein